MSEYWVSHKKYFCKYCNIYIADDAPSRRQHESGLRHKGNVERFVRGLYKAGEKRKHDLEEEKREMARVEKAAQAAFAQDVGSGLVKPGSSSAVAGPSKVAAAPKAAASLKPTNPFANYTTAESLGITDPDEARRRAEAERRQQEGVAGEWEVVDVILPPSQADQTEEAADGAEDVKPALGEGTSAGTRAGEKRPAEQPLDDEDTRGWKLRRKKVNVGLGELYDPGAIPIKLKTKKEEQEDQGLAPSGGGSGSAISSSANASAGVSGALPPLGGTEKPRWSARGWNKPGASSSRSTATPEPTAPPNGGGQAPEDAAQNGVKSEEDGLPDSLYKDPVPSASEANSAPAVKVEESQVPVKSEALEAEAPPPAPSGGSLFKKRKVPVAGGSRGGRRF
ncbi:hypothetical protein OH77DRAFT_1424649 [Trametes cingulata]|nr:hypothetical protein OH77DRAFT_1424649 [Trametes cingulata]